MKKIKNVKIIIWDCDNTIWIHRKDEINILSKHFGISNISDFEKQYSLMLNHFTTDLTKKKITFQKVADLIQLHMPVLQESGIQSSQFLKEWLSLDTSFLNEDALDTIRYLSSKGYKHVVLTDWFWNSQIPLLEKYGVLPYMEQVYTCDNEYLKCNPKSKSRIIKEGREDEYFIIGDTLNSDIAFANIAGIRSAWFNPYFKENCSKYKPTYILNSICELCKIL